MGRGQQSDGAREEIVEQLRRLLSEHEPSRPTHPRPFPSHEGDPEPWSNPPPNGFGELRKTLRSPKLSRGIELSFPEEPGEVETDEV